MPRSNTGGMTRVQVAQMTVRLETEARQARSLRKAAFHVFSSLAANDEDIRKRLIGNFLSSILVYLSFSTSLDNTILSLYLSIFISLFLSFSISIHVHIFISTYSPV